MNTIETAELWKQASRPALVTWAIAQHEGQRSICPLGWFMRTSFAPPMVAVSIAPARFTHGLIAGSGEIIEPDDGILAIGSGGAFALAAARGLLKHSNLTAEQTVREALEIASGICIYTNANIEVLTLDA